jgi:hypothetical protein
MKSFAGGAHTAGETWCDIQVTRLVYLLWGRRFRILSIQKDRKYIIVANDFGES